MDKTGRRIYLYTILFILVSWLTNIYKLTECDFKEPYKCEIIYAIGLVPPAAIVTAWIDIDEGKN